MVPPIALYPKGKRQTDGTGYTRATIATCQQARLLLCFSHSILLFYSYRSSFFPIISLSYNNRRAGQDRPTRAAMATPNGTGGGGGGGGGQAGTAGTSSVTCFLPTLLFSSSHFYYLFCRELQQQMGRVQIWAGQDGTTQAATAMRTGRGAGGREEEVGKCRKAGYRGTWGHLRRRGR